MPLSSKRAEDKIVEQMDSTDEQLSLRGTEDIVEFTKKVISPEDHERRIKEIEDRLEQAQSEVGLWRKGAVSYSRPKLR